VSELSGKASIKVKAEEFGIGGSATLAKDSAFLRKIKSMEKRGYSFELADASLELLMRGANGENLDFFEFESFRVISDKSEKNETLTEATVKLKINGKRFIATGEGNGPVNALDNALRKAISSFYPEVDEIELSDYKVRVLDESKGTDSTTRVIIESSDSKNVWGTTGVSDNIIEASFNALMDSIIYKLVHNESIRKK
jgi:2-isopropylmalate synthase